MLTWSRGNAPLSTADGSWCLFCFSGQWCHSGRRPQRTATRGSISAKKHHSHQTVSIFKQIMIICSPSNQLFHCQSTSASTSSCVGSYTSFNQPRYRKRVRCIIATSDRSALYLLQTELIPECSSPASALGSGPFRTPGSLEDSLQREGTRW